MLHVPDTRAQARHVPHLGSSSFSWNHRRPKHTILRMHNIESNGHVHYLFHPFDCSGRLVDCPCPGSLHTTVTSFKKPFLTERAARFAPVTSQFTMYLVLPLLIQLPHVWSTSFVFQVLSMNRLWLLRFRWLHNSQKFKSVKRVARKPRLRP